MIAIEYKKFNATWSSKSEKWTSTDKNFAAILNQNLPDNEELDMTYLLEQAGWISWSWMK